ncbi:MULTISPECIES: low molecular weight protein tyrosine phosphatase family protein [unclassified Pseudomonas]|uniref:low molecular weight protein tyrosine phosphatase family protein n=1 Tax=unclassified Pseudomonas TaxID=196821 RepID=UPI0010F9DCEC|nr:MULTISPECIES: low molecular weight protein tyrosine phosphatase family protein [unclassified Pseudomonas]
MQRLLFICSQNRLRSPTAELLFSMEPSLETLSAGISNEAENPLTPEALEWADLIFVMEQIHKRKLTQRFARHLKGKRVICLDIPDVYAYMDPELIKLLLAKVSPFLK